MFLTIHTVLAVGSCVVRLVAGAQDIPFCFHKNLLGPSFPAEQSPKGPWKRPWAKLRPHRAMRMHFISLFSYLSIYLFIYSVCSVWAFQLFQMWWKYLRGLNNCSRDYLDSQPGLISVQSSISSWVYKSVCQICLYKDPFLLAPWGSREGWSCTAFVRLYLQSCCF